MFVAVARVLIELVLAGLIGAVVLSYSTAAIYWWIAVCVAVLFVLHGGPVWVQRLRDRRRARLPKDEELGFFDQGERIEPLWQQRWRLNQRLYKDSVWMDRQIAAGLQSISDVRSGAVVEAELPRIFDRVAARVRSRVRQFEQNATTHAMTIQALMAAYAKVLEKPGSALIVPNSLTAFRKRSERDLRRHLTEDLAIWERILSSVRNMTRWSHCFLSQRLLRKRLRIYDAAALVFL